MRFCKVWWNHYVWCFDVCYFYDNIYFDSFNKCYFVLFLKWHVNVKIKNDMWIKKVTKNMASIDRMMETNTLSFICCKMKQYIVTKQNHLKTHEFMLEKSNTMIIPSLKITFVLYEQVGTSFPEGFLFLRLPFSQYWY